MGHQGVRLPGDAAFKPFKDKRGKYVLDENGSIALVLELGREGPFVAYLQFNGTEGSRLVYDEFRFAHLSGPRGVELGVERCVVSVEKAELALYATISPGHLVISEEGTFVAARHWQAANSLAVVNVHTGALATLYGNESALVADEWSLAGYRGEEVVFEVKFPHRS